MRVPLIDVVLTAPEGTPIFAAGLDVTIYKRGTESEATVYAAESGATQLEQPLATDSEGRILGKGKVGWVEEGSYDLAIEGETVPWEATRGDAGAALSAALNSAVTLLTPGPARTEPRSNGEGEVNWRELPHTDPYDYGYDPVAEDNTDALNDAIAALPAGSGGTVLIPGPGLKHADTINATKRKNIRLLGQGGPMPTTFQPSEWPASNLMYTGAGERGIDMRSCHGPVLDSIGVGYNNNDFEGVLIDFAHNGGADTTCFLVNRCMIQGVGRVGSTYQSTAKALIALDQAISGQILGTRFHHAKTAIRGQEAGTYSNAHLIQGCFFGHCYGYIANPGQGWNILGNTFEGLQGGNIDYPHHAVYSDLAGGGSVTGVWIAGNWMGDAFGEQEWIRLKPLNGSVIGPNFISGGLGAIRFFNNEENQIVGSGVTLIGNTCLTPNGFGIDLTNGDNIAWEGLAVIANGLGANFDEGPILNIPTGSPDRDVWIAANYLRNPPPIIQPFYLPFVKTITAAETITLVSGSQQQAISGNTSIKTITPTFPGHLVQFKLTGTGGFSEGGNLKLNGTEFTGNADDTLTLVCDGTNWIESARSVN